MDLNAEVDNLVKASQAWIPMIMEYGSRVLLAVVTLAIGWAAASLPSGRPPEAGT